MQNCKSIFSTFGKSYNEVKAKPPIFFKLVYNIYYFFLVPFACTNASLHPFKVTPRIVC